MTIKLKLNKSIRIDELQPRLVLDGWLFLKSNVFFCKNIDINLFRLI